MRTPLTGYNHNVSYKRRTYHVQTEDSGVDTPHVFSHVFINGAVLSTARLDYTDLVEKPDHEVELVELMRRQHQQLMRQLIRGELDQQIESLLGSVEPKKDERKVYGYHHQVKYSGRLYSIETRYSRQAVTDLYLDQTLLASTREECGQAPIEVVRKMAQEQHKRMLKGLLKGERDEQIIKLFGSLTPPQAAFDPAAGERRKALLGALSGEVSSTPRYQHRIQYQDRVFEVTTAVSKRAVVTELSQGAELITRREGKPGAGAVEQAREQHKRIIRDLRDGVFDETIELLGQLEQLEAAVA